VNGRSRAESQVGVRLMGVWRVSYSNIQDFFFHTRHAHMPNMECDKSESTLTRQFAHALSSGTLRSFSDSGGAEMSRACAVGWGQRLEPC
jgi:hypothetical protein